MAQPTVRPIQPPLQEGSTVTISGQTFPNCEKFSVNFTTGPGPISSSDILLHCDTRFGSNNVVRNSFRNGGWEGEESGGGAPNIQKGGPFEMVFQVHNDKFSVSYNGRQFCDFKHRLPIQRATHVIVSGDGVQVTNIMFGGGGGYMGASTMGGGYAPPPYSQPGQPAYGGAQPGGYPGAQPGGYPGAQSGGYPGGQPGGAPHTEKNIPGGMRPGQIAYVNFTLSPSPNTLTVNLKSQQQGGDILMHFNVRFGERVAIKNSLQNGQWGQEERTNPANFPFPPGQPVQMMILADPQEFKIAVGGQHFTEFRLRNPNLGAIQWIDVSGDVTNTQINIP